MPLYKISQNLTAERIKSLGLIQPEERLHELIEKNIGIFFPTLILIKHKPIYENKELDTLAFDTDLEAPVILEFKVSQNKAVSDQVDSYISIMLKNKELISYQIREKLPKTRNVNFNQARIIIIANEYSETQINALSLRTHYVEMWKYNYYQDHLLLENVQPPKVSGVKAFEVKKVSDVSKEIIEYQTIDHFRPSPKTRKLYEELHNGIMNLSSGMQRRINKFFIGYKDTGYYFVAVKPKRSFIKLEFKSEKPIKSPILEIMKSPPKSRRRLYLYFKISSSEQLPSAMKIIKQIYEESV